MADDYQELSDFVEEHASDPLSLAKILTAWEWASLLPGGHGTTPTKPQDVPTVLNASCGWRVDDRPVRRNRCQGAASKLLRRAEGGHTCLELYINGKWMFFDPTFGIYFESKNGGDPLSIEEARADWPDVVVNPKTNKNSETSTSFGERVALSPQVVSLIAPLFRRTAKLSRYRRSRCSHPNAR
jgi:hypothetical protein